MSNDRMEMLLSADSLSRCSHIVPAQLTNDSLHRMNLALAPSRSTCIRTRAGIAMIRPSQSPSAPAGCGAAINRLQPSHELRSVVSIAVGTSKNGGRLLGSFLSLSDAHTRCAAPLSCFEWNLRSHLACDPTASRDFVSLFHLLCTNTSVLSGSPAYGICDLCNIPESHGSPDLITILRFVLWPPSSPSAGQSPSAVTLAPAHECRQASTIGREKKNISCG